MISFLITRQVLIDCFLNNDRGLLKRKKVVGFTIAQLGRVSGDGLLIKDIANRPRDSLAPSCF